MHGLVCVNRDHHHSFPTIFGVKVVASADSLQMPAILFQQAAKLASGNRRQTAISTARAFFGSGGISASASISARTSR